MTDQLLPCPFCGGYPIPGPYIGGYSVQCSMCGARTPDRCITEELSWEAWNRRTTNPEETK